MPTAGTSGPISLATPYGSATSAADFFVVPSGKTATDIGYTGRIVPDGADLVVSLGTANKLGLIVFNATRGQTLRLIVSPVSFASGTVSVYSPWGVQIATGPISTAVGGQTLLLNAVPTTGTYTIRLDVGANTGSATFSLKTAIAVALGTSTPVNLTRTLESGAFTFTTTAGQWVGMGISGLTTAPAGGQAVVSIFSASGKSMAGVAPLACTYFYAPGGRCAARNLPAGTYTVFITPQSANTASMTLTLTADATGTLTANSGSQLFNATLVGQAGHYNFNVTSTTQHLTVVGTGSNFTSNPVFVYVLKPLPDGTQFGGTLAVGTSGNTLDLTNFPVTGTYYAYVAPTGTDLGHVTIALTQDDSNTITAGGSSLPINLAAGQNGRYTFTTTGQWVSLAISSLSFTPSTGSENLTASVYNSSNTVVSSAAPLNCPYFIYAPGGRCAARNLPAGNLPAGTYTLVIDPQSVWAASMTLTLSSDVSGSLTVNGSSQTFTATRLWQTADYSFSVPAGQSYKMLWSGSTFPSSSAIYVLKPDGTSQGVAFIDNGAQASGTLNLGTLSTAGTYYVYIVPYQTSSGQVTVRVTNP